MTDDIRLTGTGDEMRIARCKPVFVTCNRHPYFVTFISSRSRSFGLDANLVAELAHTGDVLAHHGLEFLRPRGNRLGAQREQALPDLGEREYARHSPGDALPDRQRRSGRCEDSEPVVAFVSGQAGLREARHAREKTGTSRRSRREYVELAGLGERNGVWARRERIEDSTRQGII